MFNGAHSIWNDAGSFAGRPALTRDLEADVCVVGAGITGLTLAYLLAHHGKRVVVLEGGFVGGGETGLSTAHLTSVLDLRLAELEKLHGTEAVRLAVGGHQEAIDFIHVTAIRERVNCDLERLNGYLFATPGETPVILEQELAVLQRAGVAGIQLHHRAPLACFNTGPCLVFPRQGQIHPLKYLQGLATAVQSLGGAIFRQSYVAAVEGGETAVVETNEGRRVRAAAVVVATHTPVNDRLVIHTKQAARRTYVIAARVPDGFVAPGLYSDTGHPYHYVRLHRDSLGSSLIIGGEDHKTGQADDADVRWHHLEAWARERFPMMRKVDARWSGQILEPVDGLAYIGRNPMDAPNVFVATGFSGNGLTYGTLGALLIRDLILGRSNPWAALYDPARINLEAAGEFAREALNTAAQYGEWATAGSVSGPADIPPGTGGVIRQGLKKIAVYCDDAGRTHECSAVCPHLGGIVRWNHAESTWDCPCHGSRFDKFGKVINGPANTGLSAPVPHDDLTPVLQSLHPEPVPHF